jgi:hypothetical protein
MRKSFVISIFASFITFFSTGQLAWGTETDLANPQMFDMPFLVKSLQNDVNNFKCVTSWDAKSNKTEIYTRCTKKNAEVYIHANAKPMGKDQYEGGSLSYFSFTVKTADLYQNLEVGGAQMCAGKVGPIKASSIESILKWFKSAYPGVKNKQVVTKVFNGYKMSIIGGLGEARTVTCGNKPQ